MNRRRACWRIALLAAAACLPAAERALAGDPDQLVIVAAEKSPLRALSAGAVRKLFLGVPTVVDGVEIVAVRNLSDEQLQEVFLQKVLFMSAHVYERRLLSKLYREGGSRVLDINSRDALVRALLSDPRYVTYMRRDALSPGLKVIGEP